MYVCECVHEFSIINICRAPYYLERIGEKVKEKHVIHAINGLSSKFDNTASFIRRSKPILPFYEAKSMLLVEEHRLLTTRTPPPSHVNHSSSHQLLNVTNSTPNRGGRNHSCRNHRGGSQNNIHRHRPPSYSTTAYPTTTIGTPFIGQRYS